MSYIGIDHEFIRRYAVNPANIHDSQILPLLLAPEHEQEYVCQIRHIQAKFRGFVETRLFRKLDSRKGSEATIHLVKPPKN